MKNKILAMAICVSLMIGVTGCGTTSESSGGGNNNNSDSQEIYATMTMDELNQAELYGSESDNYKKYLGKKIKVTGAVVSNLSENSKYLTTGKLMTATITCSNEKFMSYNEGDIVNVTGVVDETWTVNTRYTLNNCVVEKQ